MKKIYLSEGETGFAQDLGNDLVVIDNIPFDGDYNIDDVVEIENHTDRHPTIKRLIYRAFPVKKVIFYDEIWQFYKISEMVRCWAGKTEGAVEPKDGKRGFMIVACSGEYDPLKLAESIGVKNPADGSKPWEGGSRRKDVEKN